MKRTVVVSVLVMLIAATSCHKKTNLNDNITTPIFSTYSSLDTIFGMLSNQSKTQTILSDSGGSFTGLSGTRYIFPKSCFVDASAANVTGNVQITVAEYLKKGDMVFSKVLPVTTANDPLLSAGELYVYASQNGKEIFMKGGYSFTANIPRTGKYDTSMSFFYGQAIANPTNNKVNWRAEDTTVTGTIVYAGDTLALISDSLHWCNADKFLPNPDYQSFTVSVVVTGGLTPDPSALYTYAFYDNYKGVWPLYGINGNTYSVDHVPNIPVHFVSYALINGHFYGGVFGATPLSSRNYTVTLTEVDPTAFKAQLNGLYP